MRKRGGVRGPGRLRYRRGRSWIALGLIISLLTTALGLTSWRASAGVSDQPTAGPSAIAAAADSSAPAVRQFQFTPLRTEVGCARDTSAKGLADFFAAALGPVKGFDEPRATVLPDGRVLWILQDPFIDFVGDKPSLNRMNYMNNVVLIQSGLCFSLLVGGSAKTAVSFELGDAPSFNFNRFFWAGGSTVASDKLYVFWIEMHRDNPSPDALDGLTAHPAATWVATYDLTTLTRLDFRLAPNSGVTPVYGYGAADDGAWTYLFGNTYLQNLALDGGYGGGPHSATRMYLARVPRGQVMAMPEYWNGSGWSADASDAVPISNRFYTENIMLPVKFGGLWYSATKINGFLGNEMVVDVAPNPWGPYRAIRQLPVIPRGDPSGMVTYHAAVMPWLDPTGGLIVTISQIPPSLEPPSSVGRYRPNFVLVPP